MSETPQPQPELPSKYNQYKDATAKYYGSDTDPLKFAPAVKNPEIAHTLALQVEQQLSNIDEAEIAAQAISEHARYRLDRRHDAHDIETSKQEIRDHKLRIAVVNVETSHASLAPEDFNEDSKLAGAYTQGNGIPAPKFNNPEA